MTINGIDISTYNAKQFSVSLDHVEIDNSSEAMPGATVPVLLPGIFGGKTLTLTLTVHGDAGRKEILKNCSDIVAACRQPVILELDGFENRFRGALTKVQRKERSLHRWHLLTLTFYGYEYGDTVTAEGTGAVDISNPGNINSPAVITIVPSATAQGVTVTGICPDPRTGADKQVSMDVTAGRQILIDGYTGIIREGNSNLPKEIEIEALPAMVPGYNEIVCSDTGAQITASVIPVYA